MTNHSPHFFYAKIFAIILAVSLLISYLIENSKRQNELISDSRKIDGVISENFDYVHTLGVFLGKQIIVNNHAEDVQYIDKLFKDSMRLQGPVDSAIAWSMFSWANKKNKLAVNTVIGINTNLDSLTERPYIWRSRYQPWTLQFSKPDRGIISNSFIMPAAVGITNGRDEYLGTIIAGINIKKLTSRVEAVLKSSNAFIVVSRDEMGNDDTKMFFSSSNTPKIAKDYMKIANIVSKYKEWDDQAGKMSEPILAGRFKFSYYKILEGYPLIIFVGFNQVEFWKNILVLTTHLIILFTLLVVIARGMLYWDRR